MLPSLHDAGCALPFSTKAGRLSSHSSDIELALKDGMITADTKHSRGGVSVKSATLTDQSLRATLLHVDAGHHSAPLCGGEECGAERAQHLQRAHGGHGHARVLQSH